LILQVVMAVFAYLYYNNYVAAEDAVDLGGMMTRISRLPPHSMLQLLDSTANLVASEGLLPDKLVAQINVAVAAQLQRLHG
jgi:hypothetical protein